MLPNSYQKILIFCIPGNVSMQHVELKAKEDFHLPEAFQPSSA